MCSGGHCLALKYDDKFFFNNISGFIPYCGFKGASHTNENFSQKTTSISAINKVHLKCVYIDASVVNGMPEPVLFNLSSDNIPGYKVFSELETTHVKKKQIWFELHNIFNQKMMITKKFASFLRLIETQIFHRKSQ